MVNWFEQSVANANCVPPKILPNNEQFYIANKCEPFVGGYIMYHASKLRFFLLPCIGRYVMLSGGEYRPEYKSSRAGGKRPAIVTRVPHKSLRWKQGGTPDQATISEVPQKVQKYKRIKA